MIYSLLFTTSASPVLNPVYNLDMLKAEESSYA
jgi:hypothetical protein